MLETPLEGNFIHSLGCTSLTNTAVFSFQSADFLHGLCTFSSHAATSSNPYKLAPYGTGGRLLFTANFKVT